MSLSYRLALRVFPREFRLRYGAEMERVFEEGRRDARAAGTIAELVYLSRSAIDLGGSAFRESVRAIDPRQMFMSWVVMSTVFLLAALAGLSIFRDPVLIFKLGTNDDLRWHAFLIFGGAVATALIARVLLDRFRKHYWLLAGSAAALAVTTLAYLAHDEATVRDPITIEQFAPEFPGADRSFAVLMRYGNRHPVTQRLRSPDWDSGFNPTKPAEWRAFLTEHRAAILRNWAELAPVREWIAELNGFDRIGDLTAPRFDSEMIGFAPIRYYYQRATEIAGLQTIDGDGDAALATLLPVVEVSHKLEADSRTLVRAMVGRIMQRAALMAAANVIDNAVTSSAMRARFALAMAGGGGPEGARRVVQVEFVLFHSTLGNKSLGDLLVDEYRGADREVNVWIQTPLNLLSPFLYNPRATANLFGDVGREMSECASRRDLAGLNAAANGLIDRVFRTASLKNIVGCMIAGESIPAYNKIAESYWDTEDLRASLAARLKA